MIKEWATVVSWQNGQALVSCDVKASCSSCASRAGCGSRVLNKLGPQTTHTIVVPCDEPLVPGQKVELGIAEGSLLSSALLVYMSPLVGLFLIASLFQLLFASDVAALCGAVLGGIGGFLAAFFSFSASMPYSFILMGLRIVNHNMPSGIFLS